MSEQILAALKQLRNYGKKRIMVTGRPLDALPQAFSKKERYTLPASNHFNRRYTVAKPVVSPTFPGNKTTGKFGKRG